ncbi:uridine phosphorylase [Candidatus Solincola sp.]|nr:uridine phosphorylase [Actinomycetota bacterium]MDI7252695.1 uridine phosphorylase [Actinomycetota bacterium]
MESRRKAVPSGESPRGGPTSVYHLSLRMREMRGARFALLPGDPARVEVIAGTPPLEGGRELAWKREFRTWLAYLQEVPVIITSTGIGGPSTAIAVEELARLGVETFIRVGTTGAIQPHVRVGEVVITTGAVRLDGASAHYAPPEYPAVADYQLVEALVSAARELGILHHVGVTCSSDTFYPGQERPDSFRGYIPRRFRGMTEEWRRMNVLNYEMEAATLLTMCGVLGLRGGCVTGVIDRHGEGGRITKAGLKKGEGNAVAVAVRALELLVGG